MAALWAQVGSQRVAGKGPAAPGLNAVGTGWAGGAAAGVGGCMGAAGEVLWVYWPGVCVKTEDVAMPADGLDGVGVVASAPVEPIAQASASVCEFGATR